MPERTVPVPGDVIVRRQERNGTAVYILRAVPGPDQLLFHSRACAIACALAFAAHQRVRVWLADEQRRCTPLDVTGPRRTRAGRRQGELWRRVS